MLNDTSAHDTLWKLIKDMRFGMLTHRTATGMLHARFAPEQYMDY